MKKGFIILLMLLGILFIYSSINPWSIYLSTSEVSINSKNFQKGDTIQVLENYNFDNGDWRAYILIEPEDSDNFSKELPKGRILKTTDKELLKRMQKDWKFIYIGGDFATVQSRLIIYKDDNIVFQSNIVLEEQLDALQSGYFGALFPTNKGDIIKYCKQFKRVYSPIVFL